MVNRPSQPEIITVNSEDLQTQIRDLLPSQNGFGSELQATNVITPIIDLTRAAEGSSLPEYLQRAQAFGSQTSFAASSGSVDLITSTGFWQITGSINIAATSAANSQVDIRLNDGTTDKRIYYFAKQVTTSYNEFLSFPLDFNIFLRAGDKLYVVLTGQANFFGSYRQVATGDGTLVQPNGYPL